MWRPGSPPARPTGSWCPAATAWTTSRGGWKCACARPRAQVGGMATLRGCAPALTAAPAAGVEVHIAFSTHAALCCGHALMDVACACSWHRGAQGVRAHAEQHADRHRAHAVLRAGKLPGGWAAAPACLQGAARSAAAAAAAAILQSFDAPPGQTSRSALRRRPHHRPPVPRRLPRPLLQTPEGVRVPKALQPFMMGIDFIPFRKMLDDKCVAAPALPGQPPFAAPLAVAAPAVPSQPLPSCPLAVVGTARCLARRAAMTGPASNPVLTCRGKFVDLPKKAAALSTR